MGSLSRSLLLVGSALLVSAQSPVPPFPNSTTVASTVIVTPVQLPQDSTTLITSTISSTSIEESAPTSPPEQPAPACPESNGQEYIAASGRSFTIECGIDRQGGDMPNQPVWLDDQDDLEACILVCDSTESCIDVSVTGKACYLKSRLGAPLDRPNVLGAKLTDAPIPLGCPANNGEDYIAASGRTFLIECGIDHAGGDMPGGPVYVQEINDIEACIGVCDRTLGCIDVSLSGTACYLKSTLGAALDRPGILGAKLVTRASATATEVSTLAATSSTTSPTTSATSSSSASSSSSSTSSSASSSAPATLKCPGNDGAEFTAPSGQKFVVECGIDHQGSDIGSVTYVGGYDLAACITKCDQTPGCVDVSLDVQACYLKSFLGQDVTASNIWGAKKVDAQRPLSCPYANGLNYTVAGKTFVVECGADYATTREQQLDPVVIAEADYPWLQSCIDLCGQNAKCVNVALSGRTCYMKSSIEGANVVKNAGVSGARQIASEPSAVSTPTPTPSAAPKCIATAPTCPACDGVTIPSSKKMKIQCSVDYDGADLYNVEVPTGGQGFKECIDECAATPSNRCKGATFLDGDCYLKRSLGTKLASKAGVWAAVPA